MAKNKPKTTKSTKKEFFAEVDTKVDFPAQERQILKLWYENGIVDKYLKKNIKSRKRFSFLDGPITANNPMGIHHAWGRTYKDIWQRYKNMRGFAQRFQNGFDCQGLWVEVEVEKELGLKTKKDIENLVKGRAKASIAKFVELCKDRVYTYADMQTEQSKRLGYFMDWDNSYYTLSDDNNYMIWHFLKVCFEHGWIYKGNDVVPWCPRCETAVSQQEVLSEDYKLVVHDSIYVQLPISGKDSEYLLIWTTTPWTIPANTAVAVDEKIDYSLVAQRENKYWIAKETVERVFGRKAKVLKTVSGEQLVGLKYTGPYDHLPFVKNMSLGERAKFHVVVATDSQVMPITTEEGTGLVHTSTSTGQEDYRLGVNLGLPVFQAINDQAEYLQDYGELTGKNAKKNPRIVIKHLRDNGWLFKAEKYKHRYPACWRCKEELVWKVTDEWYIAMDKPSAKQKKGEVGGETLRSKMKHVANQIVWIPEFGLKRELEWLENMRDWLISKKNRYWGVALPIWECANCGKFDVIGSKKELKEKAVSGWKKFEGKTPHKPQIDEIKIACTGCGEIANRVEPVGSPWLDAGIVPFSTISKDNKSEPLYLKDRDEWKKWFPADFITESFPGQFKNWFYSLIAMSTVLEDEEPFRTVLGFATLFGEDGEPMHKSSGNAIEFNEGADKIGVDVMRWMYVNQNPADNLLFGYRLADEARRRFHLKLWNVYNFFVTYANLDGWEPGKRLSVNPKAQTAIDKWIHSRLSETISLVTKALDEFKAHYAGAAIEEFVDDLSNWYIRRSRDRVGTAAEDGKSKLSFYKTTYAVLTDLARLLAPFTPYLSESIFKNLTKSESVHLAEWPEATVEVDEKLQAEMDKWRKVVEKAHSARKKENLAVRRPIRELTVTAPFEKPASNLEQYVKDELNVKKIVWKKSTKTDELVIKLDKKLTAELEEEAKTRELVRQVQQARKDMQARLNQYVDVSAKWIPKSQRLQEMLKSKALVNELVKGEFRVRKTS